MEEIEEEDEDEDDGCLEENEGKRGVKRGVKRHKKKSTKKSAMKIVNIGNSNKVMAPGGPSMQNNPFFEMMT